MLELTTSDDPVFLSWLMSRLAEEGIAAMVFDEHTSAALAGLLGTVRCRVMVDEDHLARARLILREAPEPNRPETGM